MKVKIAILLIVLILITVVYAADVKWSALAENTTIADDDVLCIIDTGGSASQKITVLNFFDTIDTFAELNTITADKTLVNEEDAVTWDALGTFGLGVTITTGDPFTLGANRIDNGSDLLDGEQIGADTIDDDSIDWSDCTFADFDFETNWKMWHSDGSGDVTEITLGADGTFLESNGAAAAPAFRVLAAGDIPSILYNVIGDPSASGSISFGDTETATYTTVQDTAGSFISFINSNADVSNQVYMVDLDYSADTTQDNADFMRLQDAGSTLLVFEEEGKMTMTPSGIDDAKIISITPSAVVSTNEADWIGVNIDGEALDPSGNDVTICGTNIDLSGVAPSGTGGDIDGIKLQMADGEKHAIHIEEGKVVIDNTAGAAAGAEYTVVDIRLNTSSLNANSDMHAIDVAVEAGTPAGDVVAVGTHTNVAPIRQAIGTFSTPNQTEYAGEKHTGGTVWADGVDGSEIFIVDDDAVYVGSAAVFNEIEVDMATAATKSVTPTFHYNTAADTWTEFFPADDTDGFQQDGTIRWTLADISGTWTNNGDPGGADSSAGYWIKIVRTANADPGTPTPTTIKTGVIVTYFWDKTGAMDVLSLEVGNITSDGILTLSNATSTIQTSTVQRIDLDYTLQPAGGLSGITRLKGVDVVTIWDSDQDGETQDGYIIGGWFESNTLDAGATGNIHGLGAIEAISYHYGTGTVGVQIGVVSSIINDDTYSEDGDITNAYNFYTIAATTKGTGTVGTRYGYYASDMGGGGNLTNQYGVYVDDMTGATNDYGIAIAGADTYTLWVSSAADNTDAANGITFGSSGDTNLYRSGSNTLKTDDGFIATGAIDLGGSTSLEIPNGTDPDVDAAGEISNDTDGANETSDVIIRAFDGTNQWPVGQKVVTIQFAITDPENINTWAGRANPSQPIWHNTSGMTFTILEIKAYSDEDNYDFSLFESNSDTDMSDDNDTLIDLVECEADGTEVYTDVETTISHAAIEHDHHIIFEDTDGTAGGLLVVIKGWFNADVD